MELNYRHINLELATLDELVRIKRDCEENHDYRMRNKVLDEFNRREKYDY